MIYDFACDPKHFDEEQDFDCPLCEVADLRRQLTSYQIAKDNLELRLARAVLANAKPIVGTFAGHWTY